MDFWFSPSEHSFREEVRSFLDEERRRGAFEPSNYTLMEAYSPSFTGKLADRGWIGLAWPKEHGGAGRSHIEQLILTEELMLAGAPVACHWLAERQVGPAIIASGTPEQQRAFLPGILKGQVTFCMGLAEPGAGSDLASLQIQAQEKANSFMVDGQKTLIMGADKAQYIFLLARTGATESRHRGLSVLLVDLRSPGITIRPLVSAYGERSFNDIFFDNVEVPRRNLLGEKNGGWLIATQQLSLDKSSIELVAICRRVLHDLTLEYIRGVREGLVGDMVIRHAMAEMSVEIEVSRWLSYRVAWMQNRGLIPEVETSTAKVFGSELTQRLANEGMKMLGLLGQLADGSGTAPMKGWLANWYLSTLGRTIGSGTSEIQRTIIAQRGLGLPR
ncbi:MAG: acyl-CoA dehydrogenase family protein [Chloroflexi bacterium]|nr:acyl-CoA dehydrogenase family protein [Chloroflexota bacterium]